MDFEFNEDQKMFRESMREFLDKEIAPLVDEQEKKGPMTKEEAVGVLKRFKKIGIGYDLESMSEMAGDPLAVAILMEETFRVWPSAAGLMGLTFPAGLVNIAPEEMRKRLLPRLMENELIGCYAITEPEAGSDNRAMRTAAIPDGDFYVVNGTKTWITNGPVADLCLLVANDEKGERIFLLVDREESPFETADLHKLGWRAAPTGELYFNDCRVPKGNNVMQMAMTAFAEAAAKKPPGEGGGLGSLGMLGRMSPENIIFAFLRSGMALAAAGISQAALDAAISFARERMQFGRPIGRHQLIQEKLYDMKALTVTSRLLGYWALQDGHQWGSRRAHGVVPGQGLRLRGRGQGGLRRHPGARGDGSLGRIPPGEILPGRQDADHPRRDHRDPEVDRRARTARQGFTAYV